MKLKGGKCDNLPQKGLSLRTFNIKSNNHEKNLLLNRIADARPDGIVIVYEHINQGQHSK
jgi:DNA-binding LacI/PurR family transcriptional regulator